LWILPGPPIFVRPQPQLKKLGINDAQIETYGTEERPSLMVNEEEVLAALDKARAIYALQQRLDPSSKSTDALQDLLMRMRTAGKVKFDIKTGKWSKA